MGEHKLTPQDWPAVVDMVLSIIIEALEELLGRKNDGYTYFKLVVMNGITTCRDILKFITGKLVGEVPIMNFITAERVSKIKNL